MTATEAGSRLRLVFLVRNLEAGGVQRGQSRLAGAIAARGHPVDLVACMPRQSDGDAVPAGLRLVNLRPSAKLVACYRSWPIRRR